MPENENSSNPKKKKRGFLWTIIIILIIVLAGTIGGYALFYYNALPAWVTDLFPNPGFSSAQPIYTEPAVAQQTAEEEPEPSPSISPAARGEEEPDAADDSRNETITVSGDDAESAGDASVTAPAVTAVPYIGADAAAEAALEHSKTAEKDADFSSVLLKEQNGMLLYEVIFTAGDFRYEYYIDCLNGRVESWKKTDISLPAEDALAASAMDGPDAPGNANAATGSPASSENTEKTGATVLLGEDEAKKLAMAHANITEKDISSISCKIELQGLNLIYKVDMKTQLMEYEYEVDAITGDIVGFDVENLKAAK